MLISKLRSQSGNALIEIIPIMTLFVLLANFALGFFGVVHTGILNSIAARNYAFETMRNRTNLNYLRDLSLNPGPAPYNQMGQRWHTIVDNNGSADFLASRREIKFSERTGNPLFAGDSDAHNIKVRQLKDELRVSEQNFGGPGSGAEDGVNPVWIMSVYGICLNATCRP